MPHDFAEPLPMRKDISLRIMQLLAEDGCTETLHKNECTKAKEILNNDLKVFSSSNEVLFEELSQLLAWNKLMRENKELAKLPDNKSDMEALLIDLKKLLEENPSLCYKLQFPSLTASRLNNPVNQRKDMNNANEILMEEPKLFSSTEEDVFSKINDNLREQKRLPNHKDMMSVRAALFAELRKLLDANARLHDKLKGPTLMTSKLREFVNQSLKQYDNGTVDSIPKVQSKSLLERFTLITEPSHCQSLRLTGNSHNKIVRLVYTNSGVALLALASNAVHLLWKWHHSEQNPSEKATARGRPQLWQPASGNSMSNNVMDTDVEGAVHCFAMTSDDKYVVSASGGMISVFSMVNFKASEIFESPPPAATYFAFYPGDNNIIAIGMEDSTIKIYNVKTNELVRTLKGHTKKITGLAFSNMQDVILVSSDANAKICVWTTKNWKRIKIMKLTLPSAWRCSVNRDSDTIVEFRRDQFHILVVHKTLIAIYKAIELNANVRPIVIAAHPSDPNQFALGLTDGSVLVLEPVDSEGTWGVAAPPETGSPLPEKIQLLKFERVRDRLVSEID